MIAARDNPFRTARVETVLPYDPTWFDDSWEAIFERLDQLSWRAAVVGPHGSGKTTFMEALAGKLAASGEEVVPLFTNRDSPPAISPKSLAALDSSSVLLFDGAEQLSGWAWRRFLRKTARVRGLIVTGHRPGRLPTVLRTRVTPEILERCIGRLDPGKQIDPDDCAQLFTRHAGNVREALLECYDASCHGATNPTA